MLDIDWTFQLTLLFALVFVALFSLLILLLNRNVRLRERVESEKTARPRVDLQQVSRGFQNFAKPIGRLVPRSEKDLSREELQLVQAGLRGRDSIYVYYGVRVLTGLLALAVGFAAGVFRWNALAGLMLALLAALALPDIWLRMRIRKRKRLIEWGLPDFMDLSLVCVEAGLGLDQTIQRVGNEIRLPHPELGEELRIYSLEVAAGRTRADALRSLADRTGVDEIRSFAAVLIQSDRFGTSVGQTLRVFSEDLRIKRRQKAEEAAAKLTVKLVLPMILFIFPAILAVAAGPAVIAIVRQLFGTLGGSR